MQAATVYPAPVPSEASRTLPDSIAIPDDHDVVDEWGEQSFPASDPPQNW